MDTNGRTVIASILFLDVVGFSQRPVTVQHNTKARLNAIIRDAIDHVAESDRIVLDTGDGAAICFLGDPEDALFAASWIGKEFAADEEQLRMGINLGPVKGVTDINGSPNVLGDGINVAQRVMDFAADGEILVSRSYYEVVARLHDGNERLFHYVGSKHDKHVREHQVYAFSMHDHEPKRRGTGRLEDPPARTERPGLTAADLKTATTLLVDRIGPIATVIVKRAAEKADSAKDLYQTIAAAIPDEADRASFLAGATSGAEPAGSPPAAPRQTTEFDAARLNELEGKLAQHIGPLAKILVKKNAKEAVDLSDLYDRLAQCIQDEDERQAFMTSATSDT